MVNKGVIDYEEDNGGVRVHTQDGSTYEGAMLVGADGFRSTIRKLMMAKAEDQKHGSSAKLRTTDGG